MGLNERVPPWPWPWVQLISDVTKHLWRTDRCCICWEALQRLSSFSPHQCKWPRCSPSPSAAQKWTHTTFVLESVLYDCLAQPTTHPIYKGTHPGVRKVRCPSQMGRSNFGITCQAAVASRLSDLPPCLPPSGGYEKEWNDGCPVFWQQGVYSLTCNQSLQDHAWLCCLFFPHIDNL